MKNDKEFLISPDLENDNLTKEIEGFNEAGEYVKLPVVKEIPLTIYLNKQEIVTYITKRLRKHTLFQIIAFW